MKVIYKHQDRYGLKVILEIKTPIQAIPCVDEEVIIESENFRVMRVIHDLAKGCVDVIIKRPQDIF